MSLNEPPRTPQPVSWEDEPKLQEVEMLESQVKQMAHKILHYRTTLPDQLKTAFSSILTVQRPLLPLPESGSEPGPSGDPTPDAGAYIESGKGALLAEEDKKSAEKICLVKQKVCSNISAMPIVLKRMNECISMIGKFDSYNGIVHPVFQRKKTS
ncbi:hypothetical protein L1049_018119 [Liquidambar formosana]|uniref:Uncharacterized protein n=1 Tax=Liquidambar formosana TaxID=63359 RepID=A0AAP0R7Q9_LIQFO